MLLDDGVRGEACVREKTEMLIPGSLFSGAAGESHARLLLAF
jgi:hypothetical protein